jgi:hypothetical protein
MCGHKIRDVRPKTTYQNRDLSFRGCYRICGRNFLPVLFLKEKKFIDFLRKVKKIQLRSILATKRPLPLVTLK